MAEVCKFGSITTSNLPVSLLSCKLSARVWGRQHQPVGLAVAVTTEGTFHDAIEGHQADMLKELHRFPICDQLFPFILGSNGDRKEKARDSSARSAFTF